MKRVYFLAAILAVVLCSVQAQAAAIGKVVAVLGAPTSSGPGGNQTLRAGSQIFEHDKITVTSGNAQIELADGTKLVVGPASSLRIEKFLMRGGSSAKKVAVTALRGTFRFITGRSAKSAYDIRTANATIGIRGTGFDFSVLKNTAVAVHEGKVKLCGKGACLNLNAGCELGETAPPKTQKLVGRQKAGLILERLPFIAYQTGLNKSFRLNTNACRAVLSLYENERSGSAADPVKCVPSFVTNGQGSGC
jgi:hypothetical protein